MFCNITIDGVTNTHNSFKLVSLVGCQSTKITLNSNNQLFPNEFTPLQICIQIHVDSLKNVDQHTTFSSFWELNILYENRKKNRAIGNLLLTCICLYVFAHVLNSHTNVNRSELSTPIDLRRMADMQNFGLYSTVHIHVKKTAQTYIEVCNTADFHTCVLKIIGLKNRTRVSIQNCFVLYSSLASGRQSFSHPSFFTSSSNLSFWVGRWGMHELSSKTCTSKVLENTYVWKCAG